MAVGDIYQVQVHYNIGSELTMNVVHLREKVVSTDDIPAETVAHIVFNNWETFYESDLFSDQAKVALIQARRIKPTTGIPSTLLIGSTAFPEIIGTGVGAPVPSVAALLISLYTSLNDKNGRGRIYIPGVDRVQQNDGQLIATAVPLAEDICDILEADQVAIGPGTGTFEYCVYSRELASANVVSQAVARSNLATQRGRRNHPGIGV